MRILVNRIDGIGDNILGIPFLINLRKSNPNSIIDLLVRPYVYESMKDVPYVNNVRIMWWEQVLHLRSHINMGVNFFKEYDWVLCPRWGHDIYSTTVLLETNGPRKSGHDVQVLTTKDVKPEDVFDDVIVCHDPIHVVKRSMFMLKELNMICEYDSNMVPYTCTGLDESMDSNIKSTINNNKFICLSIACSCNDRKWSIINYKNLITKIVNDYKMWCVIVGGSDVKEDGRNLNKMLDSDVAERVLNLTGWINVANTYEVMKRSECIIGNDSGPIHMASTTNNPVISIFREGLIPCNRPSYWSDLVRHMPYSPYGYAVFPKVDNINTISSETVFCKMKEVLNI